MPGLAPSSTPSQPEPSHQSSGEGQRGLTSAGSGRATNSRRHGRAIRRAHRLARFTRALSVAIPVFAYIWR